jgi:hypothetical protein
MDAHGDGPACGAPFAPAVLKVADQVLLLRIDRDRGLAVLMPVRDPVAEVPKLRVAIGMRRPFARFPIGLQTVPPFLSRVAIVRGLTG